MQQANATICAKKKNWISPSLCCGMTLQTMQHTCRFGAAVVTGCDVICWFHESQRRLGGFIEHFKAQWLPYVPPVEHSAIPPSAPHSVFMCSVQQTAIISLYSVNWLVFITET
jgi:hypothetical protein